MMTFYILYYRGAIDFYRVAEVSILCAAENLSIYEQDCGLDFFDPTDWRYPHRLKEERKNTAARQSSRSCGIAIF